MCISAVTTFTSIQLHIFLMVPQVKNLILVSYKYHKYLFSCYDLSHENHKYHFNVKTSG